MTTLSGLFACGYDVVVFVDETVGGNANEDGSRFVMGRAIDASDHARIRRLDRMLAEASAERWHATERRGLFQSDLADEILVELAEMSGTVLFDLRETPSALDELGPQFESYRSRFSDIAASWPPASHERILLYAFLERLAIHIAWRQAHRLMPGERTLVICDRQSWWADADGASWYREVPIARESTLHRPFDCEVRAIVNKSHPSAQGVLRWVNLVDSELWAIGRTLRRRNIDGLSLDRRLRAWADSGRPDVPVLEPGDVGEPDVPRVGAYLGDVLIPMSLDGRSVDMWDPPATGESGPT